MALPSKCDACGMLYKNFRAPEQPTFATVKEEMFVASDDPKQWRRRSRGVVLGKMFEHKQEHWRKHLEDCERAQDLMDWVTFADPVPF